MRHDGVNMAPCDRNVGYLGEAGVHEGTFYRIDPVPGSPHWFLGRSTTARAGVDGERGGSGMRDVWPLGRRVGRVGSMSRCTRKSTHDESSTRLAGARSAMTVGAGSNVYLTNRFYLN